MRRERILGFVMSGTMAVVALGCSSGAPSAPAAVQGFNDTTGEGKQTPVPAVPYPAAPYGLGVGSVIPNFDFEGFANAPASQTMHVLSLAQFYNPHGLDKNYQPAAGEPDDRLFPADSGFANAGKPKPTVLLIDIASVWCGPCNQEAGTLLPFKHDLYSACGGEFLLNLHDSLTPGITATPTNLKQWTTKYGVNFPAVIDPAYKLDPLFQADAFPNNLVIDLTTMTIVTVVAGEVIPGTCSDNTTICGTDADLATCADTTLNLNCNSLAACPSGPCTQFPFWSSFEAHLDKSRTGCTVK
jgi:hypothetical protein